MGQRAPRARPPARRGDLGHPGPDLDPGAGGEGSRLGSGRGSGQVGAALGPARHRVLRGGAARLPETVLMGGARAGQPGRNGGAGRYMLSSLFYIFLLYTSKLPVQF